MAWQNQAQYSFKMLMTNIGIGVQSNSQEMVQAQMQATKKLPSKCEHQDQVKGLCRKMPWNREMDFDLECLNYHNRVFSK